MVVHYVHVVGTMMKARLPSSHSRFTYGVYIVIISIIDIIGPQVHICGPAALVVTRLSFTFIALKHTAFRKGTDHPELANVLSLFLSLAPFSFDVCYLSDIFYFSFSFICSFRLIRLDPGR